MIVAHLRTMERQLEQTQATVVSLRTLLEGGGPAPSVQLLTIESSPALAVSAEVAWDDTEAWMRDALTELRRQLDDVGAARSGPDGALYSEAFFAAHVGEVTAFVPITGAALASAQLAGGPVAVTVHRGPYNELDRAYAALGTFVAERGIGTAGAIRENYQVSILDTDDDSSLVTEVCWPTRPTQP